MANKELRSKLTARIAELEYQVKYGKLDPKIALTAMMEETVSACVDVLERSELYCEESSTINNAITLISIKD